MELDVREVAAILHVPEYTVYKLIDEDNLPASQINGQYRFNRVELLEWASQRSVNPIGIVPQNGQKSANQPTLAGALESGGILTGIRGADKETVLRNIVDKLPLHDGADREGLLQLLLAREKAGSTAIGGGIAIPHSRYPVVLPVGKPLLTLCYLEQPVPFGNAALGQVDTLFVLVSPTISMHLHMLARLAAFVQDDVVKQKLKQRSGLDILMIEAHRVEQNSTSALDRARTG